ncbi:MAG: hypothetical protein KDA30_14905 [Phycisphaerales bacterium]|nr:hypothetical protein [Phycisphaerales bacterium]
MGEQKTMTRDDVMRSTLAHVRRVGSLLGDCAFDLIKRANCHDDSKFSPEEFEAFVEATPRLAGTTYGSDEYRESLKLIRPALDHHNAHNRHHPEHHADGIKGMNLLDLIEMLCDWKAATERHNDGCLTRSIIINAERFGYSPDFARMLWKTAQSFGWIDPEHEFDDAWATATEAVGSS